MKESKYHMNVGAASILLLIVVLAMTVFAVLSIRASYHEVTMAERNAESVEDYYAADTAAECIYAEINRSWEQLSPEERTAGRLTGELTADTDIPLLPETFVIGENVTVTAEGEVLQYSVQADYSRSIHVSIKISEDSCHVIAWKLRCEETGSYAGEEIEIWDGEID